MANHKSSEKRARQTLKKTARNYIVRSKVKTALRSAREAKASKATDMVEMIRAAVSNLQNAAKKGIIHPRTAARKISRISKKASV